MILLLLCLLVPGLLYCQDIGSILPDSFAGLKRSGEAELYRGSDLYKLIDGGADIFFEYGFVQAVRQRYSDTDENNTIDLEIYEMKDSAASFGIFSLFTHQTGEPIAGLSEAYGGGEFLLMRRGNYYISITVMGSKEPANSILLEAANRIERNILSAGTPHIVDIFKNYTKQRIVYIKGSLGLYNLSPVNFGNNIAVNECIFFQDSSSKVFVINYFDEPEANNNYRYAINILKNDKHLKIIHTDDKETSFNGTINIELNIFENYLVIAFSDKSDLLKKETDRLKVFLAGKDKK